MFKTILTTYGLASVAAAEATGTPISLTHMAVGDGNGNPVEPSDGQTNLVRELYRAPINRVYQDPDTPTLFTAELVIPASAGGFVLREVGVFDADGGLFASGNLPDTYKPQASEGAYADTVVRLQFMVTNADVVNVLIDPNVAVATQTWVLNAITLCHLAPGGTTGQVLRKTSNACGDAGWADPGDFNVVVDIIEEKQILAAGQTQVILGTVTTNSLAVYIDGLRIGHETGVAGWLPDVAEPDTEIVLGQSYAAGTVIRLVQNEPAGAITTPLARDQNLGDVPDKAAARVNLDVFSRSETRQMAPAGQVAYFARNTAPAGWLKANGSAVSRTAYADLFAAIGTTFGAGDGFNTFKLPDLRGEFVRGWSDGRAVDASRTFGSTQTDELKAHTHQVGSTYQGGGGVDFTGSSSLSAQDNTAGNPVAIRADQLGNTGGTETRPRNIALLACIKF